MQRPTSSTAVNRVTSTAPVSGSTSHSQIAQPFGNTGSCISLSATTASPPDNSLGRRASAESRANSRKPYALSACGAEKRPSANCTSARAQGVRRSEEHTSELQSPYELVCRLLLEKKNKTTIHTE